MDGLLWGENSVWAVRKKCEKASSTDNQGLAPAERSGGVLKGKFAKCCYGSASA